MEHNHDFRKRHFTLHQLGRRNMARQINGNEVAINSSWSIGGKGGCVTENAVKDLQDYLWTSMEVSVRRAGAKGEKTIWFEVDDTLNRDCTSAFI